MSNLVDQNISSTPDVDVANSDGGLGSTHAQEEPPPSHLALEADFSSFVYLAFAAAHAARPIRDLPSYLKEPQSVASSVVIGHGRSFFVSRKTAPAEPERQITNPLDGMTIGHTVPARPARVIVYKLAQVEFDKAGIPVTAHRTKFASVLLDLLALSHPPLIRHPNIVTLLGLAWSENQVDEGNRIPVPILEYADKGTLDRLERTRSLSGAEKRRICLDVANAIAFVHQCGIIHGDIKSENILMFSGSNYRYTAKLCDFGSSVIGGEEYLDFAPKGTKRWAAPEVRRHTVTRNFLPQIDVYAFGLLAWRLALDGTYPLIRVFVNREEDSSGKSLLSSWLAGKVEDALDDAELDFCIDNGIISKMALKSKWTVHHLTLTLLALPEVQSLRPILEAGNWSDSEIMEKLTATISSDHPFFAHVQDMLLGPMSLYSAIDGVLKNTLHPDPSARNLVAAIAALTRADEQSHINDAGLEGQDITRSSAYQMIKRNHYPTSWFAMRALDPGTQDYIIRCMRHRAGDDPLSVKPAVEFILAALQISGVGSDRQECYEDALRRLTRAAQTGSTGPLSLIYRMHDALGKSVPSIIDVPNSLFDCAAGGSIAAFQDLDAVAADQVPSALNLCVRYTCPVGASFYADEKLLNEWKFSDLRERAWVEERLSRSTVPHEEVRVNVRGDRFLHAAAALGMSDIVQCLLEKYAMPVNLLNDMGETALICAVRSGHFDVAYRLLAKGASASIASQRGETALHWLISIHDNVIPGLIGALMARGGAETLTAAAQRCDYAAPKISINLDNIDLLTIGTPLHWAVCRGRAVFVSALLKHGAHPYYEDRASDVLLSPVQLASALHEPNILRLLVDKATGGRERPLQSIHETMRRAIDGSDRFYLIARHGVLYRSKMRETFVQLCRELRDGNVTVQDDCSPLQWAANGGFEEAASLILAHMTPSKMVNKRWGAQSETPIFAAVRRNHRRLVRLLREHGADPLLLIGSPGRADVQDWSLLHVAAESVFGTDCSMAEDILASGISPDGPSHEPADASETRLAIAVHAKAFNLARLLRMRGADVDAVCFHTLHGRAQLKWATTILGRVIAINLRNSRSTIDWLLRPLEGLQQGSATSCSFIVVPSCGLTALHLAALGESVFVEPLERDEETALDLLEYLLEYFGDEPTQLNQTDELGRTALHCAAQVGWKQGVLMLCQVDGMDVTAKDQMERTAMDVVLEMLSERSGNEVDDEWKEVIDILGDVATGANDLED